MIKKLLLSLVLLLTALVATLLLTLYLAFGGGQPYPDLTKEPLLPPGALEIALESRHPIGNAAAGPDGAIYYTVHPEAQPDYPKIYRAHNGKHQPFPAPDLQRQYLQSPLGLVVDRQNRLWVADPGHHGLGEPAVMAFDLDTGKRVHRHAFSDEVAPLGSFVQDLQVSSDGRWVYLADVGFWAKRPALIVHDTQTGQSRRLLSRHPSVMPEDWLIRTEIRDMRYLGGLMVMKTGVDGIALSRDDRWLYYGAMNHSTMYRLPTQALQDSSLDDTELAKRIEAVGQKPLNDGLSTDAAGNVLITDVENQAVLRMSPAGKLETLVRDERIRWADGLSFGPDGWLYLADSAIPHLILQSRTHIRKQAPYVVWRFRPGNPAFPGQ